MYIDHMNLVWVISAGNWQCLWTANPSGTFIVDEKVPYFVPEAGKCQIDDECIDTYKI
jgi:hypothetical protein